MTKADSHATCENDVIYWKNEAPKCHIYDYCLTLDKNRSATLQFSTKTGYRINKSQKRSSDFEIESDYFGNLSFKENNKRNKCHQNNMKNYQFYSEQIVHHRKYGY